MAKRMLIDATHPEETRVVVVSGTRLEHFDVESSTKRQLKGNIYLARVTRVEPSLQAAFVDYGGNRHGFLAFAEIHPDYYQIPLADRQTLLESETGAADEPQDEDEGSELETLGEDPVEETAPRIRRRPVRDYKIQEVIKRRQILLIQVVKEERGNKGAALTTYLSLAGRYCVLMPNTGHGGGVSRKITSVADRKRLKAIMQDLDLPPQMAIILRTAGQERSKAEIKRDYEYLIRTWNQARETTLASRAPCLIHEEGNLIRRSIRDVYAADIDEVIVDGDEGYRGAKDFMKILTPSHAKKVRPYKDGNIALFQRYQVDAQLDAMLAPVAQLRSGGYVVINQTEALVAIDVNSGRATKERHIEETALKTNLEAADEIARQLRLRDLSGLIVIDFIDMEEGRNNAVVERRIKDALRHDRARIQVGQISPFGLLELSRQRLRPSLMETSFHTCHLCKGTGMVRSVESAALYLLRAVEEEGTRRRSSGIVIHVATPVALYILNHKRKALADIEQRYGFTVVLQGDDALIAPEYKMERVRVAAAAPAEGPEAKAPEEPVEEAAEDSGETVESAEGGVPSENAEPLADNGTGRKRRKRRKRRRRSGGEGELVAAEGAAQAPVSTPSESEASAAPVLASSESEASSAPVLASSESEASSAPVLASSESEASSAPVLASSESEASSAPVLASSESEASSAPVLASSESEASSAPVLASSESEASAAEDASSKPRRRRVERSPRQAEPAATKPVRTRKARTSAAAETSEASGPTVVLVDEADDAPKRRGWWSK